MGEETIAEGVAYLQGDCFCGQDGHTADCGGLVETVLPMAMPVLGAALMEYMLNRLKGLKDAVPKGEDSCGDALIGYIADLAGTIASCAISVIQWELVVACVATAIGAANDCYPCVCEAVEWTCGCDVC